MLLIKIQEDGSKLFPYTIGELKSDNPSTSFPEEISTNLLEEYGIHQVRTATPPEYDSLTHTMIQGVEFIDVEWRQKWEVVPLPESAACDNIRLRRNRLLQESDWTQLLDVSTSEDWVEYRQALRDMTSQPGFPWDIEWPTAP